MHTHHFLCWLPIATCLAGCGELDPAPLQAGKTHAAASDISAEDTSTTPASGPLLSMQIDGVSWRADREIWGAVHPFGLDRNVLMSGSFGPKDSKEQTFNLNLHAAAQPGRYRVQSSAPANGAVQLAGLSEQRYLAGNVLGYDVEVELLQLRTTPVLIEARFEGTLVASDGARLNLSDGHFRYSE